ncbi:MAG TPA: hypothetical protein VE782_04130, partial [Myxococcaceae bacterium]|nr:hypothetical protein [Myxococcaceae bacterium]
MELNTPSARLPPSLGDVDHRARRAPRPSATRLFPILALLTLGTATRAEGRDEARYEERLEERALSALGRLRAA